MSSVDLSRSYTPPPSAPQVVPSTPSNADLGVNAASTTSSQAVSQNITSSQTGDTSTTPSQSYRPAPGPDQGQNVDLYA